MSNAIKDLTCSISLLLDVCTSTEFYPYYLCMVVDAVLYTNHHAENTAVLFIFTERHVHLASKGLLLISCLCLWAYWMCVYVRPFLPRNTGENNQPSADVAFDQRVSSVLNFLFKSSSMYIMGKLILHMAGVIASLHSSDLQKEPSPAHLMDSTFSFGEFLTICITIYACANTCILSLNLFKFRNFTERRGLFHLLVIPLISMYSVFLFISLFSMLSMVFCMEVSAESPDEVLLYSYIVFLLTPYFVVTCCYKGIFSVDNTASFVRFLAPASVFLIPIIPIPYMFQHKYGMIRHLLGSMFYRLHSVFGYKGLYAFTNALNRVFGCPFPIFGPLADDLAASLIPLVNMELLI